MKVACDIDLGEDGRFIVRVGGPADEIEATRARLAERTTGASLNRLLAEFGGDPQRWPSAVPTRSPARLGGRRG